MDYNTVRCGRWGHINLNLVWALNYKLLGKIKIEHKVFWDTKQWKMLCRNRFLGGAFWQPWMCMQKLDGNASNNIPMYTES